MCLLSVRFRLLEFLHVTLFWLAIVNTLVLVFTTTVDKGFNLADALSQNSNFSFSFLFTVTAFLLVYL